MNKIPKEFEKWREDYIEIIQSDIACGDFDEDDLRCAMDSAYGKEKWKEAVKPKRYGMSKDIKVCPVCDAIVATGPNHKINYCPNCGAKLDWTEHE